ncbi:fungal-specific transcription factor domain-containing protein [Lipomyces oligophaga]|uniref:fungal-specific transcription factor domain-containing protein n=1 Tax=Lipomyces oligophaga TaxID=45792 RepID=UPI0034CDA4F5
MTADPSLDEMATQQNSKPGRHISYRRARASRACEVCHSRKVRCDVTNRMPCTNCVAFGCECRIPDGTRRRGIDNQISSAVKNDTATSSEGDDLPSSKSSRKRSDIILEDGESDEEKKEQDNDTVASTKKARVLMTDSSTPSAPATPVDKPYNPLSAPVHSPSVAQASNRSEETLANIVDVTTDEPASVRRSGRVAYLGATSNISLLVQSKAGDSEVYHYPLPDEIRVGSARLNDLDPEDVELLNRRGAFLLPPRDLCDELIECFFSTIHPLVPMINKTQFMRRYKDPENPPSLLLLQSILLAGTRVCRNPLLLDQSGSSDLASLTLYKRAKALYDANYEDDRIVIVQSLVLLGWWWEGPEDVTKNVFYWTRVALTVAQGFGLHRSVEKSQLSIIDKRLWKRVWWVLFCRDRSVSIALGRPVLINTDDIDVPMITEDDFIEEEGPGPYEYPPNSLHVKLFIHSLKLWEIMGLILRQQFSVASETSRVNNRGLDITQLDMALGAWMNNLPEEIRYPLNDPSKHNFFKGILHLQYYTMLSLLHRTNMSQPRAQSIAGNRYLMSYPSRGIAFQAAHSIARIMDNMTKADELQNVPAFTVYTLFSAMIMLIYQTKSNNPAAVKAAQHSLKICMHALEELGKSYIIARMILRLFEKAGESKLIRDRICSAINPRPQQGQAGSPTQQPSQAATAATIATPDIAMPIVPPAAPQPQSHPTFSIPTSEMYKMAGPMLNVSYERTGSQPVTPAAQVLNSRDSRLIAQMESMETSQSRSAASHSTNPYFPTQIPLSSAPSPATGLSSSLQTPMPAGVSIPGTPLDFYFITHTPPISQTFVDNFQPSQLFPDSGSNNAKSEELSQPSEIKQASGSEMSGAGPTASTGDTSPWAGQQQQSTPMSSVSGGGSFDFLQSDLELDINPDDQVALLGSGPKPGVTPDGARFAANMIPPSLGNPSMPGIDSGVPSQLDMNGNSSSSTPVTAAPSTLNVGDWYHYLIANQSPDAFSGEMAELAQSRRFSMAF